MISDLQNTPFAGGHPQGGQPRSGQPRIYNFPFSLFTLPPFFLLASIPSHFPKPHSQASLPSSILTTSFSSWFATPHGERQRGTILACSITKQPKVLFWFAGLPCGQTWSALRAGYFLRSFFGVASLQGVRSAAVCSTL